MMEGTYIRPPRETPIITVTRKQAMALMSVVALAAVRADRNPDALQSMLELAEKDKATTDRLLNLCREFGIEITD